MTHSRLPRAVVYSLMTRSRWLRTLLFGKEGVRLLTWGVPYLTAWLGQCAASR